MLNLKDPFEYRLLVFMLAVLGGYLLQSLIDWFS